MDSLNPLWVLVIVAIVTAFIGIGKWIGGIEALKEDIREIREDIKNIFLRLPNAVATSGSPLHLTDLGKKIAGEIEASMITAPHVSRYLAITGGFVPYEIQEWCDSYVRKTLYPELENKHPEKVKILKNAAYENGISMREVLQVLAIVMRDQILNRK